MIYFKLVFFRTSTYSSLVLQYFLNAKTRWHMKIEQGVINIKQYFQLKKRALSFFQ